MEFVTVRLELSPVLSDTYKVDRLRFTSLSSDTFERIKNR